MKKIKFFACLMSIFVGLSFGFCACGSDDDTDTNVQDDTTKPSHDATIQEGKTFYSSLETAATSKDATSITAASASVAALAMNYTKFKDDKEYTANFLAGVVMAKYGVTDEQEAKSEKYVNEVNDLKSILDGGINASNVATAVAQLTSFVLSNKK